MKIANNSIVALDSMIFIYLFENDERYISKVKPIFESIEKGKIKGVTSVVTLLETLSAPKLKDDKEKLEILERFFYETPNLHTQDVDKNIAITASSLRQENRQLRTPDSIQIATAITCGAEILITNDSALQKIKLSNLKIIGVSTL